MNNYNLDDLAKFPSLQGFSEQDLSEMANHLRKVTFTENEVLCVEGQVESCCYFILKGNVQITRRVDDESRVKLAVLEPGEWVGMAGLIPEQARTAGVYAKTDVEAFVLERSQLEQGLHNTEAWAFHLFRKVSTMLASQLRGALSKLDELETSILPGRNVEKRSLQPAAPSNETRS